MRFFIIKNAERRESCISFLKAINLSSPWSAHIELYTPKRSASQNRLYWAYINAIATQLDFDKETLHGHFRKNFIGFETKEFMGESLVVLPSTTKLKVSEFIDYLRKIEIFAAQNDLVLPNPDDRRFALGEQG